MCLDPLADGRTGTRRFADGRATVFLTAVPETLGAISRLCDVLLESWVGRRRAIRASEIASERHGTMWPQSRASAFTLISYEITEWRVSWFDKFSLLISLSTSFLPLNMATDKSDSQRRQSAASKWTTRAIIVGLLVAVCTYLNSINARPPFLPPARALMTGPILHSRAV